MTGIFRGRSSFARPEANEESADTIIDSGIWKAGLRLDIIDGVRIKTEGLTGFGAGPGCESGSICSRGRKVCSVRIGASCRVFTRSESVDGESVARGEAG